MKWIAIAAILLQIGYYGLQAEPTVKAVTTPVVHGEGPHWDDETGALFFVDIASRLVNRYDPKTGKVTHVEFADTDPNGGGITLVIPVVNSQAKRFLVSDGHNLEFFNWASPYENTTLQSIDKNGLFIISTVDTESSKTGNRWNDGKADARGRLWGGTMGQYGTLGSLFLVEAKNQFQPITEVTNIGISNGLAWNMDNTLLYYIDTNTNQIDVFDFDLEAGTIADRRKVFNYNENNVAGSPDGMTIDNNENLWIASFGGAQVVNVNPKTGEVIQKVDIPADQVTSVMFDGPNGDTLYATTARIGLSDDDIRRQPLSGSVFAITGLGVSALAPANKFFEQVP